MTVESDVAATLLYAILVPASLAAVISGECMPRLGMPRISVEALTFLN